MKTILITGAGSGIGKSSAFALTSRGHQVIATTETEEQSVMLLQEAKEKNITLESFKLDITKAEDREKILSYDLDVLINNAAAGETGPLSEIPLERVRNVFETNVFGTLALTQLGLKNMITKKKGTVIIVSSVAGRIIVPFMGPYSMTKFALSAGIAEMRNELHRVAPRVHAVLIEPGAYATGFNQHMLVKKYEWLKEDSAFYALIPQLKKEDYLFGLTEVKSLESIVKKVVKAAEAKKPHLRYSAPLYQSFFVRLVRLFS